MDKELIRLSHAELLLLDLVEEYGVWMKGVADGDSWGSNNKRGCEAYGVEVWAGAFERLLELGLVEIWEERRGDLEWVNELHPTRAEILRELTRTDVSFDAMHEREPERAVWMFRLTAAGGAAWEQFARPKWEQYIDWHFESSDEVTEKHTGIVRCIERELIERFLALARQAGIAIDGDTVRWREEKNWEVRRWKTLPTAHVAEYDVNGYGAPDFAKMPWEVHRLLSMWKSRF